MTTVIIVNILMTVSIRLVSSSQCSPFVVNQSRRSQMKRQITTLVNIDDGGEETKRDAPLHDDNETFRLQMYQMEMICDWKQEIDVMHGDRCTHWTK